MSCEAFKKGYNISYIPCGQLANLMRLTVETISQQKAVEDCKTQKSKSVCQLKNLFKHMALVLNHLTQLSHTKYSSSSFTKTNDSN
jgi:hypothetical protein